MRSGAVLSLVLAALAASVALAHHGPAKVKFAARMGEVTFDHARHQDVLKIACETCHHTGIEPVEKCSSCHGPQENAPDAKDAFHRQCKGCHQERQAGPTGCKDCHHK